MSNIQILDETKIPITNFSKVNDIITAEQNRLNVQQKNIESAMVGEMRLMDLDSSYRKKYTAYINIVITLVVGFTIAFGIFLLGLNFPVDTNFVNLLITVVLVFTVGKTFFILSTIRSRERTDFDKLDLVMPDALGSSIKVSTFKYVVPPQNNDVSEYKRSKHCNSQDCCDIGTVWCPITHNCISGSSDCSSSPVTSGSSLISDYQTTPCPISGNGSGSHK